MILSCSCVNRYQDKKYGHGRRVHTTLKDNKGFRCTVCGKEKRNG